MSIRVLAIDGGGIRGILPARLLTELETLAARPVTDLFDLVAGSSTGGLLALGLAAPGGNGVPRHQAVDLLQLFATRAGDLFPGGGSRLRWGARNLGRGLSQLADRAASVASPPTPVLSPQHRPEPLEHLLEEYLGETPFGSARCQVVIPAYDLVDAETLVFRSEEFAGASAPLMREVARATAAGPTYFPPYRMEMGSSEYWLTDGGVVANHPAPTAYLDALEQAKGGEITVVSVGAGLPEKRRHYLPPKGHRPRRRSSRQVPIGALDAMAHGSNEAAHRLLKNISGGRGRYWRMQGTLGPCSPAHDAVDEDNVAALLAVAEEMAREQRPHLEAALEHLSA